MTQCPACEQNSVGRAFCAAGRCKVTLVRRGMSNIMVGAKKALLHVCLSLMRTLKFRSRPNPDSMREIP